MAWTTEVTTENNKSVIMYRTYRVAEGGGDQGSHDDHEDNELDGGRSGSSHVGVLCMFPVYQCKRGEVSNYELVGRGSTSLT